jgi:hypothetical protein
MPSAFARATGFFRLLSCVTRLDKGTTSNCVLASSFAAECRSVPRDEKADFPQACIVHMSQA